MRNQSCVIKLMQSTLQTAPKRDRAMAVKSSANTSALVQTEADWHQASVYECIRKDIVSGRLRPNERLKVAELASRYETSTNPVREALQQLRGEGFVVIESNRGARVRPIDEDFVRDIVEIQVLLEPALTRWFVGIANENDIAQLEAIQTEIEALNFSDPAKHAHLDTRFHQVIYDRHYNRHAAELWWRHREVLRAISGSFLTSLSRRSAVLREHRELIEAIRTQDGDGAAAVMARHVDGSGRNIIENMRAQQTANGRLAAR
jgi:DNA-binding GntR family transcriptional regulator